MSITNILNDKELDDVKKLESVAKIVATARKAYGNTEDDIPEVKINTSYGYLPFGSLEADSKVKVLKDRAMAIKAEAITFAESTPGGSADKKIEEIISTDSLFANISPGTKFSYL